MRACSSPQKSTERDSDASKGHTVVMVMDAASEREGGREGEPHKAIKKQRFSQCEDPVLGESV